MQPGDAGYIGALNDRPSNAPSVPTKSINDSNMLITKDGSIPSRIPVEGWWYQQPEPATIKVLIRPNNDPRASSTTIATIDFAAYCKNVLPNEWPSYYPDESLKAGAVCIRSFSWYHVNNPKYPNIGADLDNTTNSQVYKPNTELAKTNSAFTNTQGKVVNHYNNGYMEQMPGYYKAGTYGTDRDSTTYNIYNNVYQNGTRYWADNGQTYAYMTTYYYPGTSLATASGF